MSTIVFELSDQLLQHTELVSTSISNEIATESLELSSEMYRDLDVAPFSYKKPQIDLSSHIPIEDRAN